MGAPVVSQYWPQYCLSRFSQYCLSTVSVLSQYCPISNPPRATPRIFWRNRKKKKGSVTFLEKSYVFIYENTTFLSDPLHPPVLSQYCPSTVSVLPQYCLSSAPSTASVLAPVLSQYWPQYCLSSLLSTVSVLPQYCPSTASVLASVVLSVLSQYCLCTVPVLSHLKSPLEPPQGFSGETEKKKRVCDFFLKIICFHI